jgi:hypothetical protein
MDDVWVRPERNGPAAERTRGQNSGRSCEGDRRSEAGNPGSGTRLGRVADEAAREARAFAEGVRQGWVQGGHHVVNLSSASESELTELPDISSVTARRIIRNRPYHEPLI